MYMKIKNLIIGFMIHYKIIKKIIKTILVHMNAAGDALYKYVFDLRIR